MSLPMISAVISSYNHGRYIRETIDCLLAQNYSPLEILVMDGASTDGTVEILKSYGDKIRWVSEKDKGQADALIKGFAKARGEIIAWINSDDLYDEGALTAVGNYFASHPQCRWLYGRANIVDEQGREIRKWVTAYKNFFCRRYSYGSLLVQNFICAQAVFFRRSVLAEIGSLDAELGVCIDYEFWLRLGKHYPPAFIDQNLGKFRLHPGGITMGKSKQLFETDYRCAKKYSGGRRWVLVLHKLFYYAVITQYAILGLLYRQKPSSSSD
jgi:glycosyltransferase involved in cell wall biosynthesis